MVSRILKDMLEPYPDIAAFKRIAYNGLPLYYFFLGWVIYHGKTYYHDYDNG